MKLRKRVIEITISRDGKPATFEVPGRVSPDFPFVAITPHVTHAETIGKGYHLTHLPTGATLDTLVLPTGGYKTLREARQALELLAALELNWDFGLESCGTYWDRYISPPQFLYPKGHAELYAALRGEKC